MGESKREQHRGAKVPQKCRPSAPRLLLTWWSLSVQSQLLSGQDEVHGQYPKVSSQSGFTRKCVDRAKKPCWNSAILLFSAADGSNSCLWCWCGWIAKLIHNQTVLPSAEQDWVKRKIWPNPPSHYTYLVREVIFTEQSTLSWCLAAFQGNCSLNNVLWEGRALHCCCSTVGSCCGLAAFHNTNRSNGFKVTWSSHNKDWKDFSFKCCVDQLRVVKLA